jgi:mRNA (2'-O-methyladenosine-N6-)-methyltransferase
LCRYPKLKELITLKDELIKKQATPPMYLKADLREFDLRQLGTKFDVILIDPPWEEYVRRCPAVATNVDRSFWTFDQIVRFQSSSCRVSFCV